MRREYGSHDKFVAAIKEHAQATQGYTPGITRQTIIRWEKGGGIGTGYAGLLAELDATSTEEDFRPPGGRLGVSLRGELEGVQGRLDRIERLAEDQRDDFARYRAETMSRFDSLEEALRVLAATTAERSTR